MQGSLPMLAWMWTVQILKHLQTCISESLVLEKNKKQTNIYFSWEILNEKNPLRNPFVLSLKSQTSDSKIRAHSFPDHSPASARYGAPCYRDETGHYVSFKKGSAAQHGRCLLCENTLVAWPDPDNDQTITQLSRPQRRPLLGRLRLQKMRGCRTGVGGLSPGTH